MLCTNIENATVTTQFVTDLRHVFLNAMIVTVKLKYGTKAIPT